jgi:hypothetical protein
MTKDVGGVSVGRRLGATAVLSALESTTDYPPTLAMAQDSNCKTSKTTHSPS